MALTLRLTKNETEFLKEALESVSSAVVPLGASINVKVWARAKGSILDKVDKAEMKAATKANATGVPIRGAIDAFESVLGKRLIRPLEGQYAQGQQLLSRLQLTTEQCVQIAKTAAADWRPGPIRALSLIRQADVLLQPGYSTSEPLGGWQGAAPLEDE